MSTPLLFTHSCLHAHDAHTFLDCFGATGVVGVFVCFVCQVENLTLSLNEYVDLSSSVQPSSVFRVHNNSIVCGLRIGSGRVTVNRNGGGGVVGSLDMNVTNEDVQVLRLHVMVVGDLHAVATGPTTVSALGVQTTQVTVTRSSAFAQRLQAGAVYTQALTTDGQMWPVMDASNIGVVSGGVLAVTNGSLAVSQRQGVGSVVDATWVDHCTDLAIVNGFGSINATFEVRSFPPTNSPPPPPPPLLPTLPLVACGPRVV
jgi:hypothetical protein